MIAAARSLVFAAAWAALAARAGDAPDVPPHLVLDGDHVLTGDLLLADQAPERQDVLIWSVLVTGGQPTLAGDIISVMPAGRPRLLVLRVQPNE